MVGGQSYCPTFSGVPRVGKLQLHFIFSNCLKWDLNLLSNLQMFCDMTSEAEVSLKMAIAIEILPCTDHFSHISPSMLNNVVRPRSYQSAMGPFQAFISCRIYCGFFRKKHFTLKIMNIIMMDIELRNYTFFDEFLIKQGVVHLQLL